MWTDNSVFYQIYPLGAAGAPLENDHELTHRLSRFESGQWLEHYKKLGVDCILFNPLFESISHGYDTTDYRTVDARLGDNEDLKHLVNTLHDNGIKVVFDAVFNHVGRDFGPFQDVLKNRENSPYKDWFLIDFNGNNSYNDGLSYQNWEGCEPLVRLNLKNPEVVKYHLDTVDDWVENFGCDGLRLDVAYCLDPDFLRALHNHVKENYPDLFLLGETLHGDYNQWCNDEMLDSVTNYECYKGLYSSFNCKNFYEILYSFNRQFGKENWCLYTGKHLLAFADNHDVTRIASMLEDKELLPALYAMLFTMPGIPCVYYGSEWGMEGKKEEGDPALRVEVKEPEENELTDIISKLAAIHHEQPALSAGDYTQIAINNPWCVYQRQKDDDILWTAINIDDKPADIQVPYNGKALDLMEDEEAEIDGVIHLEPKTFKIFKLEA